METHIYHNFQHLYQQWCYIYLSLIHFIISNWSSIWYQLMGSSYYPIVVSPDPKEILFIKNLFKGTLFRIWNWCIRKVVLDKMMKERTVYMTRNLHFTIELMMKYSNICSYLYWMTYVQIFFVGFFVNLTGTEMFIYFWNFLPETNFSSFNGLTSD